jgi:aminopeptidase N
VAPTTFDVDHYDLSIDVDFSTQTIQGDVAITGRSTVPFLPILLIDLEDGMAVSSITRGTSALTWSHAGDRLVINLDSPLGTGETFTVRIVYSGHPLEGGLMSFSFDRHAGSDIASTLSEPWFARNWWPCKESPTDKATADVRFTAPANMIAASNGLLSEVIDHGATKTWHWRTDYPIATYLISGAISNYAAFSTTYAPLAGGSMPVDFYVYPEHESIALAEWGITVDQIETFRGFFGEYPFVAEKYGMAEFPFGGAMEHQTLTSLGDCCIESDLTMAHELAHQWWGDMVTCATWGDIWLNEGFATWSEALWYEELHPGNGYRDYMNWLDLGGFNGPIYRYDLSDPWEIFDGIVYYKGAWVVHMLRGVLGESAFWNGLTAYRAAYEGASATTEDLESVFEASSGQEIGWFFDEWIYGANQPNYRYSWQADTPDVGQLTLTIVQVQDDAPPFTMPIDIDVQTTSGTQRFRVMNTEGVQSFVLDVTGTPTGVVFDPENWILDWHAPGVVDVGSEPVAGIVGPTFDAIRPLPFQSSLVIPYRTGTRPDGSHASATTLSIYDVTGRLVRRYVEQSSGPSGEIVWDGRNEEGAAVAGGVYFLRLSGGPRSDVRRVVRTN